MDIHALLVNYYFPSKSAFFESRHSFYFHTTRNIGDANNAFRGNCFERIQVATYRLLRYHGVSERLGALETCYKTKKISNLLIWVKSPRHERNGIQRC